MRLLLFPILLLAWPLAEIAGFVLVGRAVGLWGTLGLVVGTAILGGLLLRMQGTHLLRQLSAMGRQGQMPGRTLVDGAMIVIAGILLLLPGFLTDIVGLLLFVPFVRDAIWSLARKRVVVVRTGQDDVVRTAGREPRATQPTSSPAPVIDLGDEDYRRDPPSP
ncbi:membrane protein FxsA [Neorhizobium lilium]|uniref:Membrane protein FxsA n=1 Tax=Neorhizobium lilium TaxID=2503024 RepID=A0A3S3S1T6_9HYPH|nr:FxsA family protein [Neorhizobium lilium]RWX74578.1 membrane protein FxsA [Neorhizobium lilium]